MMMHCDLQNRGGCRTTAVKMTDQFKNGLNTLLCAWYGLQTERGTGQQGRLTEGTTGCKLFPGNTIDPVEALSGGPDGRSRSV